LPALSLRLDDIDRAFHLFELIVFLYGAGRLKDENGSQQEHQSSWPWTKDKLDILEQISRAFEDI
jgi:hypothetical protein